jgi:hypothetical protein
MRAFEFCFLLRDVTSGSKSNLMDIYIKLASRYQKRELMKQTPHLCKLDGEKCGNTVKWELCCLLYVATHLYMLPHTFICCHTPVYVATQLYMLPHTFICCHTPLYVATHLYMFPHTFICCHTPLYVATHLYMLAHTFICCHTPLYVDTHLAFMSFFV